MVLVVETQDILTHVVAEAVEQVAVEEVHLQQMVDLEDKIVLMEQTTIGQEAVEDLDGLFNLVQEALAVAVVVLAIALAVEALED